MRAIVIIDIVIILFVPAGRAELWPAVFCSPEGGRFLATLGAFSCLL